jgi:hypothetical protein
MDNVQKRNTCRNTLEYFSLHFNFLRNLYIKLPLKEQLPWERKMGGFVA